MTPSSEPESDLTYPICFPNTRTSMLERMKVWAQRKYEGDKFMMWLRGAAGAGKTTVASTMAKWCDEEGILLGSFAFSRTGDTEIQYECLVPTLAHRMAVHSCKGAKATMFSNYKNNPHIFQAPLGKQMKKMILEPMDIASVNAKTPHVFIIDGLDEISDPEKQYLILRALAETVYQHNPTLRILVCSRPEPAIKTTFTESPFTDLSTIISLSDDPDSDSDIRRFLVEKFAIVRKQFPNFPTGEWPTPDDIEYLVAMSSGQFIYAALAEKYVCSSKDGHEAKARLQHILDSRSLPDVDREHQPFAELDATYTLILKSRYDVKASVNMLAICFEYLKYFDSISLRQSAKILDVNLNGAWALLYELASLVNATDEENIRPYHASLADFLFDPSRSGDLYVSRGEIVTDITCAILNRRTNTEDLPCSTFSRLLDAANPRQDLMDILNRKMAASILCRPAGGGCLSDPEHAKRLLKVMEKHVAPDVYEDVGAYLDQTSSSLLSHGHSESKRAGNHNVIDMFEAIDLESYANPDPKVGLQSIDSTSVNDFGDSELASYSAAELAPLMTSPAWDDINKRLNIRVTGSELLQGLCDEAHFVRTQLPLTFATLLNESNQTAAALLCLREMTREDIPKDLRDAFAELLPHSLRHCAQQSPRIIAAIAVLILQRLCCRQDLKFSAETMEAISDYLQGCPTSGQDTGGDTEELPLPSPSSSLNIPESSES